MVPGRILWLRARPPKNKQGQPPSRTRPSPALSPLRSTAIPVTPTPVLFPAIYRPSPRLPAQPRLPNSKGHAPSISPYCSRGSVAPHSLELWGSAGSLRLPQPPPFPGLGLPLPSSSSSLTHSASNITTFKQPSAGSFEILFCSYSSGYFPGVQKG